MSRRIRHTAEPKTQPKGRGGAAQARLRAIPPVDELLGRPRLQDWSRRAGRRVVTEATRRVLSEIRSRLAAASGSDGREDPLGPEIIEARIVAEIEKALAPSLERVINATGVILHTNLGRAPLARAAIERLEKTSAGYSNLEYDLGAGARGKRDAHTAALLAELTGAEAAIVVNNNAAACLLALSALAKGGEVILSRGELIEIGDGFRIPDILAESGAVLREVGTTNRTRIRDFERAVNDRTRLLMRVHPSNFRITGFTARPSLEEMAALSKKARIPLFEDLGSGNLIDLTAHGIAEPVVRDSLRAGAGLVSFSGDKMFGGPQAGILAGKKMLIERLRRNPLFRALRVDKLTITALEETLRAYRREAFDEIPVLRMIRASAEEVGRRAERFAERARAMLAKDVRLDVVEGFSVVGGGSTPDQQLASRLIAISSPRFSSKELESRLRLRAEGAPVVARIEAKRLLLDLRTVFPEEEEELTLALAAALG